MTRGAVRGDVGTLALGRTSFPRSPETLVDLDSLAKLGEFVGGFFVAGKGLLARPADAVAAPR